MIAVAGVNRAGVWPVIIVTAGLATAAHFGVFSMPEPATLRRFEQARLELQGVGTDAAGVTEGVRGERQARLVVHLGDDTRRTMVVRVAPHEARWKFLGVME